MTASPPSRLCWFLNAASGPAGPGLVNADLMASGFVRVFQTLYAPLAALHPHFLLARAAGHYDAPRSIGTVLVEGGPMLVSIRPLWDADPRVLAAGMVEGIKWLASRASLTLYHAGPAHRPRLTTAQLEKCAKFMDDLGSLPERWDSASATNPKDGSGLANGYRYAEMRRAAGIDCGIEPLMVVHPMFYRWHEGTYTVYQVHNGETEPGVGGFPMVWKDPGWFNPACKGVAKGYEVQLGGNVPVEKRVALALALLADPARPRVLVEPAGLTAADVDALIAGAANP